LGVAVSATGTATYNPSAATQDFLAANLLFTVGASDTLALFWIVQDATQTITSVTWDQGGTNQACTLIGSKACPTATNGAIYLYGRVNPTAGQKNLRVINGTATATSAEGQSYTGTVTSSVAAACTNVLSANGNVVGGTAGNHGTAAQSGASGDMYVSGYANNNAINSVSNTSVYLLSPAGDDAAGNRLLSTGASVALTANMGDGLTTYDWAAVSCDIVASVATTLNFGWNMRRPEDRPLPIALPPDEARQFFRPSQNPVPTRWLPTTGADRERLPPILDAPDEPPKQWFVRSPNPVPTSRLPATGEDIERLPPIGRSPDEPPTFFVRSPSPVPTRWTPTTGQEDRPPNPNRIPAPDQPFPFFTRSPSPVPIIWPPTTGQEDRPPPIKRAPDEPPGPFFVRSPSPVPSQWLPTAGETEHPSPPIDVYQPPFVKPPAAAVAVGIAGMAWWRPAEMQVAPPPIQADYGPAWNPQFITVAVTLNLPIEVTPFGALGNLGLAFRI
jgi:hypothetical protein